MYQSNVSVMSTGPCESRYRVVVMLDRSTYKYDKYQIHARESLPFAHSETIPSLLNRKINYLS